jgi:ABC-type transporter Mla maintaining outer membrane lipid asymmetry ATPase subunit MlaF
VQSSSPVESPVIELAQADIASARDYNVVRLHAVDWRINQGDFWAVAGPPDSGKTDLLSTAAGLQRPASGSVQAFGHDLATLNEKELLEVRLRIGFVFKWGGRMFAHMNVAENVALALRYHRDCSFADAAPSVQTLLELIGLADSAFKPARLLPPYLQQRVGLARALALQPEILFLDEPLTGLDQKERDWWRSFLIQLSAGLSWSNNTPVTLVVTSADLAPWTDYAHQFAIIEEGHFVTQAEVKRES